MISGLPFPSQSNFDKSEAKPEHADQLARAMIELIEGESLRESLARAALEAAPKYDRRRLALNMLAEVEAILHPAGKASGRG